MSWFVSLFLKTCVRVDDVGDTTMFSDDFDDLEGESTAVWIAANGEEMVFYNVIPEPSVILLAGLGICGLLSRRRSI